MLIKGIDGFKSKVVKMMTCLVLVFITLAIEGIAAEKDTIVPPFVCIDGSKIPLANVCDGISNCPDSSDELRKLCHHIVCPASMYRCAYGACVSRNFRCDGFQDCADGSDEFRCEVNEICSDREHQCFSSSECVPLTQICNGYEDCTDSSDEDPKLCKEYPCPSHTYSCSYGGCIHQEVLCDGVKDCVDGTDEDPNICAAINCIGDECSKFTCRENEFACESGGQCIPKNKLCDGVHQCRDASDENPKTCKKIPCAEGTFRCVYGACIPEHLKCNLQANCHDWSDEDEEVCGISLPEGACRLPGAKPGTHYSVLGCPECRPGDVKPELTRLDYTCDLENSLQGSSTVYCQDNTWLPPIPMCPTKDEEITCAPVFAPGARKRCEAKWGSHQGWVPCDKNVPVGTQVSLECPEFYERYSGASHTTCLHDGTWSQTPLTCVPTCGVRDTSVAPLIIKGWEVSPIDPLPWHATLFSHENGNWSFFCGGTLIAERLILTAGHCVWETEPDTIRVVLASFSSNITNHDENTQIMDVEKIDSQDSYQDHEGNYNSDVALLILKKPVMINSLVRPACIDWENTLDVSLRSGEIGLVSGLGLTENDTFSKTLRVTSLRIVSEEKCRESHTKDFRKYLTYTTFCAGWENGTGVCNGDSGGGLVFQKPNTSIWEVQGIVSISPRRLGTAFCDPNYYTIFTKVSVYSTWIRKILETLPILGPPNLQEAPNKDTEID